MVDRAARGDQSCGPKRPHLMTPALPANACSTRSRRHPPIGRVQTRVAGLRPLSSGASRLRDVDPRVGVPLPQPLRDRFPLPCLPLQLARSRAAAASVSVASLHPAPTAFAAAAPPSLTSLAPLGHSASRWKHPRLASRFASDRSRTRLWEFPCTDYGNPSKSAALKMMERTCDRS